MSDSEHINPGDFDIVAGFESLYKSMNKCLKGVIWKDTPAYYSLNSIEETLKLENQLINGTYKPRKTRIVKIYYPKRRDAVSADFRDRVFQRSLNDNIIYPKISKSFIYDNAACQPKKGPDFARERLKCFLQRYYRKYGNQGYVLNCDIKGYYPNMSHKVVKDCFRKVIDGWSFEQALIVLDGQYYGDTGYNPGSQMVQIAGISIPNAIDHYSKEQLSIRHYGRYMDDFRIIHNSKEYLTECLAKLSIQLRAVDCTFNRKKTGITHLSEGIRYLGFQFRLSDTGKVIMTIVPENVKHQRKKLRRLVAKSLRGEISKDKVDESFKAWKNHASKGNSFHLLQKMDKYYINLWKMDF